MHLKIGVRLWRKVYAGAKYDLPKDGKLHQVAIIYSEKIPDMIEDGTIEVHSCHK